MFGWDVLQLTDGVTTLNLIDNQSYGLTEGGWAPRIGVWRASVMGGRTPYDDVDETLTLHVLGSSPAVGYSNLRRLHGLLEQAQRWGRGDAVNPVRLRCKPSGSRLAAPLESLVSDGTLTVPATRTLDAGLKAMVPNVEIQLVRQGMWLGASHSATSLAVPGSSVMTCDFGAPQADVDLGVVDLRLESFRQLEDEIHPGFLVLGPTPQHIGLVQSVNFGAYGFQQSSLVTDASGYAMNNQYLRINAPGPNTGALLDFGIGPALESLYDATNPTVQQIDVLVSLRNNSLSVPWTLRAVAAGSGVEVPLSPQTVTVVAGGENEFQNAPHLVHLGRVAGPFSAMATIRIYVTTEIPWNTIDTLDINYAAIVVHAADTTRIIQLSRRSIADASSSSFAVDVLSGATTSAGASVRAVGNTEALGEVMPMTWYGDAYVLSRGQRLYARYLATHGVNWRPIYINALATYNLVATRRAMYVVPQ